MKTTVMLAISLVAGLAAAAQAQSPLFEGQSFAISNSVAAADFFTRLGDSGFTTVFRFDDPLATPVSLSNPALGYQYDALALETPLEPLPSGLRRTLLSISLTHDGYSAGNGDFFPAGFELNSLPLEHQVFAFGGNSEPDGLFAGFPLALELGAFRSFAFDGVDEVVVTDFGFSQPIFDGGAGFWSPPPGVSVGNGVNRIEWQVTLVQVPAPSAAGLLTLAGLAATRRRR